MDRKLGLLGSALLIPPLLTSGCSSLKKRDQSAVQPVYSSPASEYEGFVKTKRLFYYEVEPVISFVSKAEGEKQLREIARSPEPYRGRDWFHIERQGLGGEKSIWTDERYDVSRKTFGGGREFGLEIPKLSFKKLTPTLDRLLERDDSVTEFCIQQEKYIWMPTKEVWKNYDKRRRAVEERGAHFKGLAIIGYNFTVFCRLDKGADPEEASRKASIELKRTSLGLEQDSVTTVRWGSGDLTIAVYADKPETPKR